MGDPKEDGIHHSSNSDSQSPPALHSESGGQFFPAFSRGTTLAFLWDFIDVPLGTPPATRIATPKETLSGWG